MNNDARERKISQLLWQKLGMFLEKLVVELDEVWDKRLVQTLVRTLQAIVCFRHSQYGLQLSELGGYVLGPAQGPAGTKRLSNLLRSRKWTYRIIEIERFLWRARGCVPYVLAKPNGSNASSQGSTTYRAGDPFRCPV